ncbi:gliding motility lipoprotein GldD [Mucilaginibacter sp.]|uniref:gliding motility lipoprotein GldD n=1 Tax=Mucilaginibacter sp. TaxID=1882438 RepID=UPI00261BDA43|nr:gliding motility lipoprotein GldD [Mucilaginibacter sp.]MDB4924891.1 gliding motility lipoprotein GldD [Mucilaginibacter sp.]
MEREGEASMRIFAVIIFAILFLAACGGNHDYSPKPRGYYRIVLPKKEYREYVSDYPFTFLYPKYANMELAPKGRLPGSIQKMEYLLNMQFPQFNGTLHLSYEPLTSKKEFNELVEDARKLAFKNTVKSSGIDQGNIRFPDHKVYGIYYTIDGNAASSVQFFLTDSVKNYLRGALYFNTEPRLDSIQPVLNFVKQDINVMIKSFRWK